jgi:hypothetical protein
VIELKGNISKRAQQADAGQAAVLVLVILIAIVLYVLLVPGPVREDLLRGNDSTSTGSGSASTSPSKVIILEEHPGTIDIVTQREFIHDVPSFNLFKTTDSEELKRVNPFYISSGFFGKKTKKINFDLSSPELTHNVMLSFAASRPTGILAITLNNNVIFESNVQNYNVEPVLLEPELLGKNNYLEFSVSGVGWQFWRQNEYSIENLRITGDITDISRRQSTTTFLVTRTEKNNVEKVYLKFNPNCNPSDTGDLTVDLNERTVFSGVPDCGILNIHELAPTTLIEGENTLSFSTDKGSYLVDLITVETRLKDNPAPIYYFELTDDQYKKAIRDEYLLNLSLEFVDDSNFKEGTVTVNGKDTMIYTKERVWNRIIDPFLQQGQNSLKLTPKDTMDIVSLKLTLQKR